MTFYCLVCHSNRRFGVFENGGFKFWACQFCGDGFSVDPYPDCHLEEAP